MNKVFDGVATLKQTYQLFKRQDHLPWDKRRYLGDYWEIDEETYDYFLGVLPPRNFNYDMFQVSEALTDDVYSTYFMQMLNGQSRYFLAYCNGRVSDMMKARTAIRANELEYLRASQE